MDMEMDAVPSSQNKILEIKSESRGPRRLQAYEPVQRAQGRKWGEEKVKGG